MPWWRDRPERALVAWTALFVIGTTAPWRFVADVSYAAEKLSQVRLNPLIAADTGRLIRPRDTAQNILLGLPFGFFAAQAMGSRRSRLSRVLYGGALGLAMSVTVEGIQLFSPWRFTSMSDVCTNTLGAAIGAAWAIRRESGLQPDGVIGSELPSGRGSAW